MNCSYFRKNHPRIPQISRRRPCPAQKNILLKTLYVCCWKSGKSMYIFTVYGTSWELFKETSGKKKAEEKFENIRVDYYILLPTRETEHGHYYMYMDNQPFAITVSFICSARRTRCANRETSMTLTPILSPPRITHYSQCPVFKLTQ